MGIVRYPIRCAGCGETFRLRLTVGLDPVQPFYLACPICSAPTRGALEWHGGANSRLVLEAGSILEEDLDGRPAVSISADIPSIASAASMTDKGGSAFLHFTSLIGLEGFNRYQVAAVQVRKELAARGAALSRLTTYYRKADWNRFDATFKALVPDADRLPTEEWHREDALHFLWDVLVIPVLVLDGMTYYPDMKAEWNPIWNVSGPHFNALVDFARAESKRESLVTCHGDLLRNIERYARNILAILPGALANMVPAEAQGALDELRLFRDDFEVLRDLYVNSFEACHKSLRWIVGAFNIAQNGDPDAFSALSRFRYKAPTSLNQFASFTSARKRASLEPLVVWDSAWDVLLDRRLRNDFGHASARHDLGTGTIIRDADLPLNYVRFVQRVHHLAHPLLACAHALKVLRIYAFAEHTKP